MILAGTSLATYNTLYYGVLWGIAWLVFITLMVIGIWVLRGKGRYNWTRVRQVQDLIDTQSQVITDLINDAERTDKRVSYEELVGEDILRRLFAARELASRYERERRLYR